MNVVLVGESPIVEDLAERCVRAGHSISLYLVEQLADAQQLAALGDEARDADVAVEVHNESKAAKRRILKLLDRAIAPDRLLLASCLACSATEGASWTEHGARVAGWGLLPPVGEDATVELARALQTSDAAFDAAQQFFAGLGFKTLAVPDGPGLVRARMLCCLVNEAAGALGENIASAADIDAAMQLGTNYPRGPLAWGDLIGLDVVLGVMTGLQEEFGEDRYRPAPLLRRKVQAGQLGHKSGRGFYDEV